MSDKVIAFGCWSNEMPIAEKGQCGVLRARLFVTEELAREYYDPARTTNCDRDDVIVRVTCESLGSVIPEEDTNRQLGMVYLERSIT